MERNKLLNADYLDIIFDGRNKRYGGYELRKAYGNRARKATAVVLLGATLALTLPVIAASLGTTTRIKPCEVVITTTQIDLPPVKPEELPRVAVPEPPPPVASIRDVVPTVVPDDLANETPPTVEELKDQKISFETHDGAAGDLQPDITSPGGQGRNAVIDSVVKPPAVYVVVEQAPEFNGDLYEYLNSHLRYPEDARGAGETGRAGVQFVVNEDGSISHVTIVRPVSPSLDAEAMRVVRNMPKWKPGKQGGKAVKAYFALPVTFVLD